MLKVFLEKLLKVLLLLFIVLPFPFCEFSHGNSKLRFCTTKSQIHVVLFTATFIMCSEKSLATATSNFKVADVTSTS